MLGSEALAAFRRRRDEPLGFVRGLTPAELERGCVHPTGRITSDRFVAMMAWHDDNHLDQLKRALAGNVCRTFSRRVAPGWPWVAGAVGPPRPVRSAKHCDSGERVTEPAAQGHPGARTRRLAH